MSSCGLEADLALSLSLSHSSAALSHLGRLYSCTPSSRPLRWSVARSPVPVIVVRPNDKVRESLEHRQKDAKKRSYVSLLGSSAATSTTLLGHTRGASLERVTTAPEAQRGASGGRKSEESASGSSKSGGLFGGWGRSEEKKEKSGKEMKRYETFS